MKILSKLHTVDFLFCDVVNSIINLLISIQWVAAKVTHIVGVILVFVCFAVSVGSCLDVPYFLGVLLFSSVGIYVLGWSSIAFNSFSTGCGRGYISQWLKMYGKDKLLSLLTARDWKLALAAWRKFQVQVSLNPAISLSRTETSVRSSPLGVMYWNTLRAPLTMVYKLVR